MNSRSTPQGDAVADLIAQGRSLLEQGHHEQAAELANLALQIAPKRPAPVLLMAQIAERRDGPERKVEILLECLETVGNDLPIRRQLAETLLQTRQIKAARAEIEKILERGTASFVDYVLLGRCFFAEEQYEKAEHFANLAKELAPDRPAPVLLLAQIAEQRSGPRQKICILRDYQSSGGDDIRVVRQLADALAQIGDLQSARSHAESIVVSGAATFMEYLLLGRICLDEGNHAVASSLAEKAREMAPDSPGPVMLLGRIAEARGEFEAKASILQQFLDQGRDDFHVRLNLAHIRMNQGKPEDAVSIVRQLDLKTCNDRQLFILSGFCEMCGRADIAMETYLHIDDHGAYGSAVLLENVLSGAIDCTEALKSHERKGLRKDNFYKALVAYGERLGLSTKSEDNHDLPPDVMRRLGQYFEARGYFDPRPLCNEAATPLVSIIAPIHRVEDETNLVAQLLRQNYPALEAIIVINGPGLNADRLRAAIKENPRFQRVLVEILPDTASLSTSLNLGLSRSRGEFIARFDADDIYMDRYISRTLAFMQSMSADISGKAHIFVHFETLGCNMVFAVTDSAYNPEVMGHQTHGSGSTLMMTRSVAERVCFDETLRSGEDRDFYFRSRAAGFKIVLSPPFDHVVMRREDKTLHTWKLSDVRLLINSRNSYFVSSGTVADVERQMNQFLDDAGIVENGDHERSLARANIHEPQSPNLKEWSAVLRGLVKFPRHCLGVAKQKFGFRP